MENRNTTAEDHHTATAPNTQNRTTSQRNSRNFTAIRPRNAQRSHPRRDLNNGEPPQSATFDNNNSSTSRANPNLPRIPNIMFRSMQQPNDQDRTAPTGAVNQSSFSSASELRPVAGANSSQGISQGRGSRQQGGRTALQINPTPSGASSNKNRSGTSPRRRNGRPRGNHHPTGGPSPTRQRLPAAPRVRTDDLDTDIDLSHVLAAASADWFPDDTGGGTSSSGGVTGLGTLDQPFELLNDSDVVDVEALVTRDEEIARELQQQEWQRASTPGASVMAAAPARYHFLQTLHEAMGGQPPQASRRRRRFFPPPPLPLFAMERSHLSRMLPDLPPELLETVFGSGEIFSEPEDDYEALLQMEERIGNVSRGLSQREMERIPLERHKLSTLSAASENNTVSASSSLDREVSECSICLSEFEVGESKRKLPCQHQLHKNCIDQWLKTNATCPVCRKDVREGKS